MLFRSPEDVAICRENRDFLVARHEIKFADIETASRFSYERTAPKGRTFGFHGVFNLQQAIGSEGFWQVYCSLDDRNTLQPDFQAILWLVLRGPHGLARAWRMIRDALADRFTRRR